MSHITKLAGRGPYTREIKTTLPLLTIRFPRLTAEKLEIDSRAEFTVSTSKQRPVRKCPVRPRQSGPTDRTLLFEYFEPGHVATPLRCEDGNAARGQLGSLHVLAHFSGMLDKYSPISVKVIQFG